MKKLVLFFGFIILSGVLLMAGGSTERSVPAGLEYEIIDGKSVTITNYNGNATTVDIPTRISGLPVTSIGDHAFGGDNNLTSINIPSTVTSIGDNAFDCNSLTRITVDNSNPSYISRNDVLFDKNIRTIIRYPEGMTARTYTIPSSVTSIGDSAFLGCSSLSSITIPPSVISIGDYAFCGSSLTSITIPSSIISISDWAFYGCHNLTNITIPSSVTSIGDSAFNACSSLASITIPSSVNYIGGGAFYDCSSLTNITIPSLVIHIGVSTFENCRSLTSITIPSTVTYIGAFAFNKCRSLTSITIPSSVSSIGECAFSGCGSLENIIVDNRNSSYAGIEGVLFDKDIQFLIKYPEGKTAKTYTIPSSVTFIGDDAFYVCNNLTSINIPSSVTFIGDGAFSGCGSLENITVDNRNSSYAGIEGILFDKDIQTLIKYPEGKLERTYIIPSSVNYIGGGAFYNCDNLTSITIQHHKLKLAENQKYR